MLTNLSSPRHIFFVIRIVVSSTVEQADQSEESEIEETEITVEQAEESGITVEEAEEFVIEETRSAVEQAKESEIEETRNIVEVAEESEIEESRSAIELGECSRPSSKPTEEVGNAVEKVIKKKKKPARPCIFCGVLDKRLPRHILTKHRTHLLVVPLLKMNRKEQLHQIARFRWQAIKEYNLRECDQGGENFM
jgi:hypothetical protein